MTQEDRDRYHAALHAVQTGVAYVMQKKASEGDPKHLRVGINSAHISNGALLELLIEKGIITLDEYEAKLAHYAEREQAMYTEMVRDLYGPNINLA